MSIVRRLLSNEGPGAFFKGLVRASVTAMKSTICSRLFIPDCIYVVGIFVALGSEANAARPSKFQNVSLALSIIEFWCATQGEGLAFPLFTFHNTPPLCFEHPTGAKNHGGRTEAGLLFHGGPAADLLPRGVVEQQQP